MRYQPEPEQVAQNLYGKRSYLAFTISVAILFGVRTVSASAKDFPCSDLRKVKAGRLISILGT
ncbi:MAG TPA: hypothetical protein VGR40_01620, partial [Candidatus Binatus sp.]|nr:hypothetical protein [Candidatus Binatus sp.]